MLQIWGSVMVTAITADKTKIDSVLSFPSVLVFLCSQKAKGTLQKKPCVLASKPVTVRKAKHLLQCKTFITPQADVVLRMKGEVNGCVIRGNYLWSLKLCNLFMETVFA